MSTSAAVAGPSTSHKNKKRRKHPKQPHPPQGEAQSDFHEVLARFRLPLAPVFLTRPSLKIARHRADDDDASSSSDEDDEDPGDAQDKGKQVAHPTEGAPGAVEAAHQMLATLVMRYLPSVSGVVLAFSSPHRFLSSSTFAPPPTTDFTSTVPSSTIPPSTAATPAFVLPSWTPSAFATLNFETSLLVWRPELLSRLTAYATPTGSSASHLSLLVHGTFNASIPREELVEGDGNGERWKWDPERVVPEGWKTAFFNNVPALETGEAEKAGEADEEDELGEAGVEKGCWVDSRGAVLGGEDGRVTFTVIKLTVADHMLSVTGSLLSPRAVRKRHRKSQENPATTPSRSTLAFANDGEEEEDELADEVERTGAGEEEEAEERREARKQKEKTKAPRKERSDKGKSRKKKDQPSDPVGADGVGDGADDVRMPPPLNFSTTDDGAADGQAKRRKKKRKEEEGEGQEGVAERKKKKAKKDKVPA